MARPRLKDPKYKRKSYRRWASIKQRCLNPNAPHYEKYGGRGIGVCDRWLNYDGFFEDMGEPPINMQIDRIDNNGDYTPENCRWVGRKAQQNNTRWNHNITYNGETKTLQQWGEEINIKPNTLLTRIRRGWTINAAFEIPVL